MKLGQIESIYASKAADLICKGYTFDMENGSFDKFNIALKGEGKQIEIRLSGKRCLIDGYRWSTDCKCIQVVDVTSDKDVMLEESTYYRVSYGNFGDDSWWVDSKEEFLRCKEARKGRGYDPDSDAYIRTRVSAKLTKKIASWVKKHCKPSFRISDVDYINVKRYADGHTLFQVYKKNNEFPVHCNYKF